MVREPSMFTSMVHVLHCIIVPQNRMLPSKFRMWCDYLRRMYQNSNKNHCHHVLMNVSSLHTGRQSIAALTLWICRS